MTPVVRQIQAHEHEIIEIKWTLADDPQPYYQRITIPPKPVREAVTEDRNAAGQVIDRLLTNDAGQRL